jgi:hypothetical protein
MELKIGDKVKFLNQKGGGIITKIIDPRMVSVLMEEGFEIPTMASELIRIEPENAAGRFFDAPFRGKVPEPTPPEPRDEQLSPIPDAITRSRKSEEIFLAYVPHDQKWLMTNMMDVILINNTSYDLLYNLFHKTSSGHYEGVDYGSVFSASQLLIATINREQLARWSDGSLQFLFHREQSPFVLPPFNSDFRIEGKKFFKEGNYRENPLIRGKGIVVKVLSLTDYFNAEQEKTAPPKPEPEPAPADLPLIFRYQVAPREAEIDLHIHELVEDPANLEKTEILDFQKDWFTKCLNSAIANNFLRLTAIHGVGNGVLRTALMELLKNYEGIEVLDAPMSKYGVGALEIRIPHNRT